MSIGIGAFSGGSMLVRVVFVCLSVAVSGCSTVGLNRSGTEQLSGTSGANGAVAARNYEALNGGLVGGTIGRSLDARERQRALEAEYRALETTPSGQSVGWKGDGGDRYGNVVPGQPYRVGSQDCRQYTHTVFSGGGQQSAGGTACRNADGSWSLLS